MVHFFLSPSVSGSLGIAVESLNLAGCNSDTLSISRRKLSVTFSPVCESKEVKYLPYVREWVDSLHSDNTDMEYKMGKHYRLDTYNSYINRQYAEPWNIAIDYGMMLTFAEASTRGQLMLLQYSITSSKGICLCGSRSCSD